MKSLSCILIVALLLDYAIAQEVESTDTTDYAQYANIELEDFSWVRRSLVKEPDYQSQNVKYARWVLGNGKDEMTIAWDESKGTGGGFDTLYVDKNFNGDLTDADEKISLSTSLDKRNKTTYSYHVGEFPCAQGLFSMTLHMNAGPREDGKDNEHIHWRSRIRFVNEQKQTINLGLLPGNIALHFAAQFNEAPIYRVGGKAVPFVRIREHRKKTRSVYPGADLGTWRAGAKHEVSLAVACFGESLENQLRFFRARFPGGEPQGILLVKNGDLVTERIPFAGGCGCGGAFGIHLFVPSRVPSGKHQVAIRMNAHDIVGGKADYLFDVTIENPDYGKDFHDPAYLALKEQFPKAQIASLRRLSATSQAYKAYSDETVIACSAWDNCMQPKNGHWDASIDNFGLRETMAIGKGPHYKGNARNLIKFDLSGIPKETKILGAWIRTTLTKNRGKLKDGQVQYFALRKMWHESKTADGYACWQGPDYKHSRDVSQRSGLWAKQGADDVEHDRLAQAAGTAVIGEFPQTTENFRFLAADISDLVKQWHSGALENHGVVQIYDGLGYSEQSSSEFEDYIFRPTLVIAYEGAALEHKFHKSLNTDFAQSQTLAQKRNVPLLVKFYSPYCEPCKRSANTIFKDKYVLKDIHKNFQFVKLTMEEHASLAAQYGITSVPSAVIIAKDGSVAQTFNSEVLLDAQKLRENLKATLQ